MSRPLILLLAAIGCAMANSISTHVLDIANGRPGVGVSVTSYRLEGSNWKQLNETLTDAKGRIDPVFNGAATPGVYKLHFKTKEYFQKSNQKTFYPFVEVIFEVDNANDHYHVPITLSNYGYSTYKGQ